MSRCRLQGRLSAGRHGIDEPRAAYVSTSAWTSGATFAPLSTPSAGDPGGSLSLAANRAASVVVQTSGPKDSPDSPIASLSTDGGVTWGAFAAMGPKRSGAVSGFVWSGTDYVATGLA